MANTIKDWEFFQHALDFVRLRKRAYQLTFTNPVQNEVLKDLARFCHANKVPYHRDPRKTDILIGRQEVFYRIMEHLNLQPEELYDIYNKPSSLQPTAKE